MWTYVTELWLEFIRVCNVMIYAGLWLMWIAMLVESMAAMIKAKRIDLPQSIAAIIFIFGCGIALWTLFPHYPSAASLRLSFSN